jgi:hypothetical protein
MGVPSCVQATCTAVNELAANPAANRTTITPLLIIDSPIFRISLLRSTVKFTLAGGLGPVPPPPPGVSVLLLHDVKHPPAQTAANPNPNVERNSFLSIIKDLE